MIEGAKTNINNINNIQEPDRNKDGIEMYSFIEVCLFYLNRYRQTIKQPVIQYPYDEFFKIIKPNM